LDDLTSKLLSPGDTGLTPLRVVRIVYFLFLAGGPTAGMFLTLLYVAWMSTFTDFNPKTKEPMTFPARLFTLPVSTPFLFWWMWLSGMAAISMLYVSWVYLVPQPQLHIFEVYQNCFGWMTLLALAQGIVWALAAWPITRMLLLMTVLLGFLTSPAQRDIIESPFLWPALFVMGLVLARVGLQKMRHGQWQPWTGKWPFTTMSACAELRGPKRFASPAQAQLWFEWRRSARGLCFVAGGLAVIPVALHLLVRVVFGLGPVSYYTLFGFAAYLLAIPGFLHFCFAASPARTDVSFLMLRPLTNGQMMMAMLKAAAISAIFSWLAVLLALSVLPLLGDFPAVMKSIEIPQRYWIFTLLGAILLTWRMIAVNLCFVWSGNRRLATTPVLMVVVIYAGAVALSILSHNDEYWALFWQCLPLLLACLIVVKFLLAYLAIRVSLKGGLLAPSAAAGYVAVWALLAAALLIPAMILSHGTPLILPFSLGIILLVPLARIGFCPIALSWSRHA
jgi:hypothetical protein